MVEALKDIQEKLEEGQIEDEEELIHDLLATLDAIQSHAEQGSFATSEEIENEIDTHLHKYKGPIGTCAHETYRATLETPAEYCENKTLVGSDYCYMHD